MYKTKYAKAYIRKEVRLIPYTQRYVTFWEYAEAFIVDALKSELEWNAIRLTVREKTIGDLEDDFASTVLVTISPNSNVQHRRKKGRTRAVEALKVILDIGQTVLEGWSRSR